MHTRRGLNMGNSIKPNIERAQKSGTLSLVKQGLNEFPEAIFKLSKNLRTLDLSENKLDALPPNIKIFIFLKYLSLNSNRLDTLPVEVGQLKKLESLLVSDNQLKGVPSSIGQLQSVRIVNFANNQLAIFPTQLCSLKNLDSLDLSNNQLTRVPGEVQQLQAIELNLNKNQISDLSEAIADCARLKVLRLDENCLEITAFTTHLLKDSTISLLTVEGNVFEAKAFHQLDGYEQYMERYTATKKKFN